MSSAILEQILPHKKFAIITNDQALLETINLETTLALSSFEQTEKLNTVDVLAVDYHFLSDRNAFAQLAPKAPRLVFIISDEATHLEPLKFKNTPPDKIVRRQDFSEQILFEQSQIIAETNQNLVYLNLAADLNTEYESIKAELQSKLNETKLDLIESRQKILESNGRIEAMRKVLFALAQVTDLQKIENLLNELVPSSAEATWIRIIPAEQSEHLEKDLLHKLGTTYKSYALESHRVFFIKGDQKSFKKDDLNLFSKITEIIQINLSREQNLKSLHRTESVVSHAFKVFNHPLALINSAYEIVKANDAFHRHAQGQKCFEILFDRSVPCQNCRLGQRFNVDHGKSIYQVQSNVIQFDPAAKRVWINLYRNRTEENYFEQRLNQTVKVKELGIISSSIAHELNNPIGGVLSYLQILLMELPPQSKLRPEIQLMIETTLRTKTIIENLLIFSRVPNLAEKSVRSLLDLLDESFRLHDLQLKNENIKIVFNSNNLDFKINVSASGFRDAVHFILSFYIEKIRNFRKINGQKTGLIEVKFSSAEAGEITDHIEFFGNCGPLEDIEKTKDISLLALAKTLSDQNMLHEMTQPTDGWIGIKIVLPKS